MRGFKVFALAVVFMYITAIGSYAAETEVGFYELALSAHERGNFQEAIGLYTKAIKADPKFAWAYSNRGDAYVDLGDYASAIKDYTKAIELDPKDTRTYHVRAEAYVQQKNYKQAEKDARKACELGDCSFLKYMIKNNLLSD